MRVYYNEIDPKAAAGLRQLMADGLIPQGDIDTRSIEDVKPDELMGYTRCHFFAGVAGWELALQLAGWPNNRRVWTGSCPCQPFSAAGKGLGRDDERHLWPAWFWLIQQCRPDTIFGEQVPNAITHGWWDDVATDMESENYACGAVVLPACSVGKPHKRDRLWFVGNPEYNGQLATTFSGSEGQTIQHHQKGQDSTGEFAGTDIAGDVSELVAYPVSERGRGWYSDRKDAGDVDASSEESLHWIECPDGKLRAIEPGVRLLADGFSERVALLRAGGNAIVPAVAAAFIQSYGEITC